MSDAHHDPHHAMKKLKQGYVGIDQGIGGGYVGGLGGGGGLFQQIGGGHISAGLGIIRDIFDLLRGLPGVRPPFIGQPFIVEPPMAISNPCRTLMNVSIVL